MHKSRFIVLGAAMFVTMSTVGCKDSSTSDTKAVNLSQQPVNEAVSQNTFTVSAQGETATYSYELLNRTASSLVFRSTLVSPSSSKIFSGDSGITLQSEDGKSYASTNPDIKIEVINSTSRVVTYFGLSTSSRAVNLPNQNEGSSNTSTQTVASNSTTNPSTTSQGSQSGASSGPRVDANGHELDGSSFPITAEMIQKENEFIAKHPECADYDCKVVDENGDVTVFSKSNHTHDN